MLCWCEQSQVYQIKTLHRMSTILAPDRLAHHCALLYSLKNMFLLTHWEISWDTLMCTTPLAPNLQSTHRIQSSYITMCLLTKHLSQKINPLSKAALHILLLLYYPPSTPHLEGGVVFVIPPLWARGLCWPPTWISQTINNMTGGLSLTGMFIVLLTGQC